MHISKLSNKTQNRLISVSLAFIGLFVAQSFGYAMTPDEMMLGGFALAGVGDIDDITDLIKKQGNAFEEFKSRNDAKVQSLEQAIIDIAKKSNRPNIAGSGGLINDSGMIESKNNLATYIRSRGEVKSMEVGSGPDGGWTVQPVLQEGIGLIVRNHSALRSLVNFITIETGGSYEEIISTTPVGAKWVGEKESRPATDTPKLVKVTTELHEEYAEPVISQRLADDSGTAMVDFLVNESGISFAEAEELALFYGTGVKQPRGLDTIPTAATADDARDWGTIEHIPTGVSGDFAASNPFDEIKKVFYKLRAGYRMNAVWVCNSETALALSLMKDGQGNYLWSEGNVKDGTPPTLLGKPVVICETAPGITADAKAIWFGDWNQAFRGIERPGNKLLLDPFTDKPNLLVYIYRRMGLQLRNSNAIKCLKFSAE